MRTLAIPLLALLAACNKPEPPTLVPERVKLTGLSSTQMSVDVTLDVTNPNAIDLVARTLEAHIIIGKNIDVGTVEIPVTTVFTKNATTKLDVPLSFQFTDLAPLARLAIAGAAVSPERGRPARPGCPGRREGAPRLQHPPVNPRRG